MDHSTMHSGAEKTPGEKTVKIKGMHCASCANIIERTIKKEAGVHHVAVNYGTETAKLHFDESKTTIEKLSKSVEKLGYSFEIPEGPRMEHSMNHMDHGAGGSGGGVDPHAKHQEVDVLKKNVQIGMPLVVLSALLMIWTILIEPFGLLPARPEVLNEFIHHLMPVIATYFLFVIGRPYIMGVWMFFRYGVANMDSLVGLGTGVAFIYSFILSAFEEPLKAYVDTDASYYDVTIVVIGLITLGKYMEAKSKLKTGDAIQKLLNLQVKSALVIRNGKEEELPVDQVRHGDILLIKASTKIPVDGVVLKGDSYVDESMLTGEAMPVHKKLGDKVAAGTLNTSGSFQMEATGVGAETLLAHIIQMVQDAQSSRAPIQKLADKISAVFVPVVLVIAVLALATWLILGSQYLPFDQALSFGLVSFVGVLVIACPCALGLATPTAVIVGVGKGAQNGILIKNAEILEKLHKVNTVVVDKTGTLTKGKPEVLQFINLSSRKDAEIISMIASLEKGSEHPLAAAVLNFAGKKKAALKTVEKFKAIAGKGVQGMLGGKLYSAGSPAFFKSLGLKIDSEKILAISAKAQTPVLFGNEKEVLGVLGIGDALKENARDAIQSLHQLGVKVVMVTGDQAGVAEVVAKELQIDEFMAEVLPEDKLKKIKELQSQGAFVAMAGDGVNDAPALAQADVGIAMSTGTDVAIETGDVTLLHGDISKIKESIRLSRFTMRAIKQNLFWAFIYNIVGIPLATGIFYPFLGWLLSPVFAGFVMAFSSVSVVGNSLRLKRKKL